MKSAGSILIVDDEDSVRRFVRTVLDQFGCEKLLETDRADRALELALKRPPIRLLLSDIDLGRGIDGIQLATIITSMMPDTKVLLMSGRQSRALELKCGWQFLAKPFGASDLLIAMRRVLGAIDVQSREAITDLTVFTLDLRKKTIPAGTTLEDFRVGPGHEGLLPENPNVASFRHDGEVLFNLAHEIVNKTRLVVADMRLHAA
jgi:DNA-binding response OmpR family regulator